MSRLFARGPFVADVLPHGLDDLGCDRHAVGFGGMAAGLGKDFVNLMTRITRYRWSWGTLTVTVPVVRFPAASRQATTIV